jgi:Zn-dependent alcohol dehydrogenases
MAKMRAFVATSSKAKPQLMKVDIPQIKDDEVLVEVAGASINPVDQMYN